MLTCTSDQRQPLEPPNVELIVSRARGRNGAGSSPIEHFVRPWWLGVSRAGLPCHVNTGADVYRRSSHQIGEINTRRPAHVGDALGGHRGEVRRQSRSGWSHRSSRTHPQVRLHLATVRSPSTSLRLMKLSVVAVNPASCRDGVRARTSVPMRGRALSATPKPSGQPTVQPGGSVRGTPRCRGCRAPPPPVRGRLVRR